MKKLKDEIKESRALYGKSEKITMMELRQNPGEIIDSAELGKTFFITKNSNPVAVLMPLPDPKSLSGNIEIGFEIHSDGSFDFKVY